ncbi:MAG: Coenzyme F420 hydrogenase/dehydrogenase, beta subunit C-terminal domain [bacterium]
MSGNDRAEGSSGGLATWFIRKCLKDHSVDRVINVSKSTRDNQLFDYQIISNRDELEQSRGSKYYPVTLADVMQEVIHGKEDYRYLITGLPCFLYGIRLLEEACPKIQKRIKILVGLVCGQCPNKQLSELLSAAQQGRLASSKDQIHFRRKKKNAIDAYDYEFTVNNGESWAFLGKSMRSLYGFLWMNKYFSHRACHFCDDTFAEIADVVFMDAWLPEYIKDPKGNNLVLVRDSALNSIFEIGIQEGTCAIERIGIDRVFRSQSSVVKYKKYRVRQRCQYALKEGKWVPPRPCADDAEIDGEACKQDAFLLGLSAWSKANWPSYRNYGRSGVFFFLIHSLLSHRRNIRYLKEWQSIVPGFKRIKQMERLLRRLMKKWLFMPKALSKD